MELFRANIIYVGKYSGKSGCAFIKAKDKADAFNYINDLMKKNLKGNGYPDNCFKIDIKPSSQGEVDFYLLNKKTYNGLVN